MPLTLPVRPELSLVAILGYAAFAFFVGLALTPSFVRFLKKNRLGKQLRVETMDGRDATIFRTYHEKKQGTPTMGGILIWGAIVFTVLFSRLLAFVGAVPNSLLQRGQVYLPLFVLLSLGILGAIDDYLNVVGANEEQWKRMLRPIRMFFWAGTVLLIAVLAVDAAWGSFGEFFRSQDLLPPPTLIIFQVLAYILVIGYLGSATAVFDDWVKRRRTGPYKKGGIAVLPKITSLLVISILSALWFYFKLDYNQIHIPFFGNLALGAWYIPLFMFIIVATANAVNFTDGLDGLAGGLLVIAFGAFGVLAYLKGLFILAGFCGVTAAAVAAFLWHNVPPALFFMGDTGALALGGALGVIAMIIDQVLVLPLIGFVFVVEALSVIIQLTSKRLRGGKKVFIAAPIHHHFEAKGWGESKVTMRLWIVGAFMAFLGIVVGVFG